MTIIIIAITSIIGTVLMALADVVVSNIVKAIEIEQAVSNKLADEYLEEYCTCEACIARQIPIYVAPPVQEVSTAMGTACIAYMEDTYGPAANYALDA
jgi:hypothetical protein